MDDREGLGVKSTPECSRLYSKKVISRETLILKVLANDEPVSALLHTFRETASRARERNYP